KPSLVQKALYGGQLEQYVSVQLCAKTLIQQIQKRPLVFLVPDANLLDLSTEMGLDVLAIWLPGQALTRQIDSNATLRGPAGSRDVAYEKRFAAPEKESEILRLVETSASHFDLLEAFGRMQAALSLLVKEDKRF